MTSQVAPESYSANNPLEGIIGLFKIITLHSS